MAYDDGTITARERQAAKNQTSISTQNVKAIQNQLKRQLANYDFADAQNRALADTQLKQNSRKTSVDRFEAQRDLQNSALGLLGSMGTALNGSSAGNLDYMLRDRNDKENNTYWEQLQGNNDTVENTYQDSLNQNNVNRRDAMQSAEKAINDTTADWRANMNNINPNLFPKSSSAVGGKSSLAASTAWKPSKAPQNNAVMSGYAIPDAQQVRQQEQQRQAAARQAAQNNASAQRAANSLFGLTPSQQALMSALGPELYRQLGWANRR